MRSCLYTCSVVYHYLYDRTLAIHLKTSRANATDAERLLWRYLRNRQLSGRKFRRQYPVDNYILDFYCTEAKLAIELDGSQHLLNKVYDQKRTQELEKFGIRVMRFWDNDVLTNVSGVLERIEANLTRNPLLKGEGKERLPQQ